MKSTTCFVCLKTSSTFGRDEEYNGRLYSTFRRFAKDYLRISFDLEDKHLPLFCWECENVVSSICQLYRELLQVRLRLSSKLGELLGFMECSESRISYKLERLLIKSLVEQLGFQKAADVDAIRSLLKKKCKLKRNETLPQVIIEHAKMHTTRLANVIKIEIIPSDLLEDMELNDDDDDLDMDSLFDNLDTLPTPEETVEDEAARLSETLENQGNLSHSRGNHDNSNPLCSHERAVSQVEGGTDTQEPQIKTEPLELDSEDDEKMMEQRPIAKFHRQEGPDSDSSFDPDVSSGDSTSSDSDSDWVSEKEEKKSKLLVASTSKNKTPAKSPAHAQQDTNDFSCPTCSKSFSTRKQQYHHIYNVHGKRIPCNECKKSFKTTGHLNEHIEAAHKTESHVCWKCQKVFKSRAYLRSHFNNMHHIQSERKMKPSTSTSQMEEFTCPSCSLVLPSRGRLNHHINQVHTGRRYHCHECSNSFKSKFSLKHHVIAFHKPEIHPCTFQDCKKTFPTKEYLRKHIHNSHEKLHGKRKETQRYKCLICARSYINKELFDRHLETCRKPEESPSSSKSNVEEQHKLLKCPTPNCSRSYFNEHALQRHLLTCKQTEETIVENQKLIFHARKPCEKSEELSPLSNPEQQTKPYKCPKPNCTKRYLKKNALRRHLLTCVQTDDESPQQEEFSCLTCNRKFSSASKVTVHIKNVHRIKRFICPSCNLTLKGRNALKQHMINIHNPESHPCSHCSKVFKSKRYLECHMFAVHPDAEELPQERRSHRCPHCPKSFFLKQLLENHILICERKHGNVGIKICTILKEGKEEEELHHGCSQCNKSFKTETHLQKHVDYVHNGGEEKRRKYPCPNCPVVYNKKAKLELHLAKCSKEEPFFKRRASDPKGQRVLRHDDKPDADGKFPCPNCPKVYPSASQRSRHIHSAHPATTFTCDQCGVIRKTSGGLQKHITAAHLPKDQLCPHCGKTLATGYMAVHIRLVHPEFAPKRIRYSCPNCPEGYYTRPQLEKHSLECPGTRTDKVSENKTE